MLIISFQCFKHSPKSWKINFFCWWRKKFFFGSLCTLQVEFFYCTRKTFKNVTKQMLLNVKVKVNRDEGLTRHCVPSETLPGSFLKRSLEFQGKGLKINWENKENARFMVTNAQSTQGESFFLMISIQKKKSI